MTPSSDLVGTVCKVHFNLRSHLWSVTAVAGPAKGRVVANVDDITLSSARMIVSEAGLRRVKRAGRRMVHAWVSGTVIAVNSHPNLDGLIKVSYNPKPKDTDSFDPHFRVSDTGAIITHADWLLLARPSHDAAKGYGWITPEPRLSSASIPDHL